MLMSAEKMVPVFLFAIGPGIHFIRFYCRCISVSNNVAERKNESKKKFKLFSKFRVSRTAEAVANHFFAIAVIGNSISVAVGKVFSMDDAARENFRSEHTFANRVR